MGTTTKPIGTQARKHTLAVIDLETGKATYMPILEFEDHSARDAFSAAVWTAVLERHPNLAEPERARA